MMKNSYTSISLEQALRRINSHLPNLKIVLEDNVKSIDILNLLIERTGMVRFLPPDHLDFVHRTFQGTGMVRFLPPDHLDFVHRTFQEYMAACCAVSEGDWGLLVRNSTNDLWKETIVLAAGLANKSEANIFISSLLDISEKSPKKQSYIDLLAISCLETATEVSLEIRKRVEERLHRIVPPKNQNQINSLVAAGELAIPYLDSRPEYLEEESAACVEALGRIGSLPALRKLGQYTKDYRKKVTNAIERALSLTTPELIRQSGLSNSLAATLDKYIKNGSLQISRSLIFSLSAEPPPIWREHTKETFDHLRVIDFDASCLNILSVFPEINKLTINGDSLPNNLQLISELKNLSWLDIRNQAEVWPNFYLSPMPQLRTLRLLCYSDEWPYFDNKDFPNLENLHVFSKEGFTGIENIHSFRKLKYFHLAGPEIPPLEPLNALSRLEIVELSTQADNFPVVLFGVEELSGLRKLVINLEVDKNSDLLLDDIQADIEMMRIGMAPSEIILRTDWSERKW